MTAREPIQRASHHVVIASAAGDEQRALQLWRALIERGLSASINDVHVFESGATALVAIVSSETADSLAFSEQITAFRAQGSGPFFYVSRDETATLPPVMTSERGETGLLQPSAQPERIGRMDRDDSCCAAQLADIIGDRLGVPRLWRLKRLASGGVVAGLGAALLLSVSVGAWSYIRSETAIAQAEKNRALGEDLLTALAAEFPSSPSGEAVLELAGELEAVLTSRPAANFSSRSITEQARLFHAIGEARDLHGAPDGAQRAFARAHTLTAELLAGAEGDPEQIFAHSQSAFWAGNSAYRAGDLEEAARYFGVYAELSAQLTEIEPENALYIAELGHAANNSGLIALRSGDIEEAAALFDQAIQTFNGAPLEEGFISAADIANTRGWRSEALHALGRLEEAAAEREREAATYEHALSQNSENPELQWALAHARYREALLYSQLGETGQAADVLEPAVVQAARLVRAHPDNIRYARLYVTALRERARFAYWRGEAIRAQLLLAEARNYIARADEAGQNDARHLDRGFVHLLGAEIALNAGATEDAYRKATEAVLAGDQALQAGFSEAHELLAHAYFTHGETLRSSGDESAALRSFRAAEAHIEQIVGNGANLTLQDLRARAMWRQGDTGGALAIREHLSGLNYERADFAAFWSAADAASSVDTSNPSDQGASRG